VVHVVDEPSCRLGIGVYIEYLVSKEHWGFLDYFKDICVAHIAACFECLGTHLCNMGTKSNPTVKVSVGICEIELEWLPYGIMFMSCKIIAFRAHLRVLWND
jgi:hypothetical protein